MSTSALTIPVRPERKFLGQDFDCDKWETIEPYLKNLLDRPINSVEDLNHWLRDQSELETVIGEHSRWIYVRTTVDTTDIHAKEAQAHTYTNIFPKLAPYNFELDKKFVNSPFLKELDQELFYTTIRKTKNYVEIFREENVSLQSELNLKQSKYDEIIGVQTISYKGKILTMQQAQALLKSNNRDEREIVFKLMFERRANDKDALDDLMSELIKIRHQIAINAGFRNYTEFRFRELGRFDYTAKDCHDFHAAAKETVGPVVDEIVAEKKKLLGLEVMLPWDADAEPASGMPLVPCSSAEDMLDKTIACFRHLDNYFAERIEIMREMKYLDLDSRVGKGPGGYNMTMPEIGVPFIFMNAANTEHDLITMVHEGGHAVHTFLAHDQPLNSFKDTPSEIAEVASMGMELMTMPYWDEFYKNEADTKRAQKNHLNYILSLLAKTSLGDAFQHWMYANPDHSHQERRNKWRELHKSFTSQVIDYSGYEQDVEIGYQRIMHFYVVPFYYIEYAFAELGAIALYKNFKSDKAKTISAYKSALQLGYTKTIPGFYETAGVRFDFSLSYISELVNFVRAEIKSLS
jgi:oligoendopeptidase F